MLTQQSYGQITFKVGKNQKKVHIYMKADYGNINISLQTFLVLDRLCQSGYVQTMSFWLCTTIWTDYDTLVLDRLCHSGYEQTYVTLVMNRLCHSGSGQTMSLWFWTDLCHSGSGQTYVTLVMNRLMSLWFWTDLCHSGYEQTNVTQVYY